MECIKKVKSRDISRVVERELWGRSAGRCEMCNKLLYQSSTTKESVQIGEKAHIYGFSSLGTRGQAVDRDSKKINDIENLILLCPECHEVIDHDKEMNRYTVEAVKQIKKDHEERIELVAGIPAKNKSHVILLGSSIGEGISIINKNDAYNALFNEKRLPADDYPIVITTRTPYTDAEKDYWKVEIDNLEKQYNDRIKPLLIDEHDNSFAVFGLAPMPILIKMGVLITDQHVVDVFQLHRDTKSWEWNSSKSPHPLHFKIVPPTINDKKPVLVISISGTIIPDRVTSVIGDDCSIWEITTEGSEPNNDNIKTKDDLAAFRDCIRAALEEIRKSYGKSETILSIFPAMSVSCSLVLGLCRMPKSDLPWKIYDQNPKQQAFVETITIK